MKQRSVMFLALFAVLAFLGGLTTGCGIATDSPTLSKDTKSLTYGVTIDGATQSCVQLIAGQTIEAGTVCLSIANNDTLQITYTTTNGWELTEAHAWVGANLADMPQTKNGNPKIGNFPYLSGDITGATSYTFSIPLSSLGTVLCNETFFAVAHAALRKSDGSGGYQNETGYGKGPRLVQRGNWAMYFNFTITCADEPPPPQQSCETAFAFGNKTFIELGLTDSRWGWQNGPLSAGTDITQTLWAGAGQNDTSKGTNVGTVRIQYDGSTVTVTYSLVSGWTLQETHVYASAVTSDTIAPGQFGNTHDLDGASQDTFTIGGFNGEDVYVIAHSAVCTAVTP